MKKQIEFVKQNTPVDTALFREIRELILLSKPKLKNMDAKLTRWSISSTA